ncbi:MAG TPA: cupin domain-containing protein [Thermoanaerobaculia bacterium]|nr:cupin domain-containing protein [Thermoanaerobaculia bacterium]
MSGLFDRKEVMRIPKPWGYELIWGHTDRYVGKLLHINQGESLSLQYHEMKDETLYVIRGVVELTVKKDSEERMVMLSVGEAFHIPPFLIHRMRAVEEAEIVEASTPELQDVVRLEDRYGRVPESDKNASR